MAQECKYCGCSTAVKWGNTENRKKTETFFCNNCNKHFEKEKKNFEIVSIDEIVKFAKENILPELLTRAFEHTAKTYNEISKTKETKKA